MQVVSCGEALTDREKSIVLALRYEKLSKRQIADAVCRSIWAVQNILNNPKKSKRKYSRVNKRLLTKTT